MTDQKAMEPFETRFADLVHTYTDPASARPVDALAVARSAMAASRTAAWSVRRMGAGSLGRRIDGGRWAAVGLAVVLVGVAGFAIVSRSSNTGVGLQPTPSASPTPSPRASAVGPVPEVLRHLWQRPLPVAPGPSWATEYLSLTDGLLGVRPDLDVPASTSAVAAAGPDTLLITATAVTSGCAVGEVGVYRWLLEGKDTFATLTAVGADACATREAALAGPWVRADLPQPGESGELLPPGTYPTTGFDPFTDAANSGRLSYTVPAGWKVKDDGAAAFVLHHVPDAVQGQSSTDTFIFAVAQPRLAAAFKDGAICGPFGDEPGVGHGVDDIVAALVARPGVVTTPPAGMSVSGYEGKLLDLSVAPSWTGGCVAPEGPMIGIPILRSGEELGPTVGLVPDAPIRLILVDLTHGRTMAIVVACATPSSASLFDAQLAAAMPVIESIELHPPAP